MAPIARPAPSRCVGKPCRNYDTPRTREAARLVSEWRRARHGVPGAAQPILPAHLQAMMRQRPFACVITGKRLYRRLDRSTGRRRPGGAPLRHQRTRIRRGELVGSNSVRHDPEGETPTLGKPSRIEQIQIQSEIQCRLEIAVCQIRVDGILAPHTRRLRSQEQLRDVAELTPVERLHGGQPNPRQIQAVRRTEPEFRRLLRFVKFV